MKNKISFIKLISLLIIVSLFLTSLCGCKDSKKDNNSQISSTPNSSLTSEVISSEDDTSSEDEILNDDIDINLDIDTDMDLDFDFDFSVTQTVRFDSKVEQKNYAGMAGILPCFWFCPDDTLEIPYTQEQLDISVEKFLQMGVKIVRCVAFEPAMAWDSKNDKWDWDSEWMQAFYKYCDIMKKNDIEVVLNLGQGIYATTTTLALENPFPVIAKNQNADIFNNYKHNNVTAEQQNIICNLLGEWLVDFYEEVVVKRGYSNVVYYQFATEPNNGQDSKDDEYIRNSYETWKLANVASHNAMKAAGYREKMKFVGPSVVIPGPTSSSAPKSAYMWLEWCVEEIDETIDIYSAHAYWRPSSLTQDFTEYFYDRFYNPCKKIIESTGKPLWCDEFNVSENYSAISEKRKDPLHATQLACAYLHHMVAGIQASPIWYLVDIKWPNEIKSSGDGWFEGIHRCGVDTSILETVIPSNSYYVYSMLGQTVRRGDTIYEGVQEIGTLYSAMLEHKDGTYSFIVVNLGWDKNNLTFELPKSMKNATFKKTVYDPLTFKATSQYRLIEPSGEIKNVNKSFSDSIGSYQVIVYNQK